jgi:hypothetical protein
VDGECGGINVCRMGRDAMIVPVRGEGKINY